MACIGLQSLAISLPGLCKTSLSRCLLENYVLLTLSRFGSTYIWELLLLRMKYRKISSKTSDEHLENSLRMAATAIKLKWCIRITKRIVISLWFCGFIALCEQQNAQWVHAQGQAALLGRELWGRGRLQDRLCWTVGWTCLGYSIFWDTRVTLWMHSICYLWQLHTSHTGFRLCTGCCVFWIPWRGA